MATSPAQPVTTVLCDVGDVIILFDKAITTAIETGHGLAPGSIGAAALKSGHARSAMQGLIDTRTWFRETADIIGAAALTQWLDYHGAANTEVLGLLRNVRAAGTRLVLLSNATSRFWDDVDFHGLRDLADVTICSSDLGMSKPDPACYRQAARLGGFRLDQATLYIDDTASWVAAGIQLGMRGHVYTSPAELTQTLATLELL